MKKRIVHVLLIVVIVVNMLAFPNLNLLRSPENPNLALDATISASSYEVDATNASKAIDGDVNTHWGTAQNRAKDEWINLSFDEAKTVKQMNLLFERSDENQNITGYKIEGKINGTFVTIFEKYEKAKQEEKIVLTESIEVTELKLTILDATGGTINWVNVGVKEFEVYADEVVKVNEEVDVNHVREAVISASTIEENLDRLNAQKANDGNKDTRWASDYTSLTNQWLKADFDEYTKIQELHIYFLNRDVSPNNSNIQSFSVKYTNLAGEEVYALQNYNNTSVTENSWTTDVKVKLETPIIAKNITLCDFVGVAPSYNNISIREFEAYSNEQGERYTLDTVIATLQAGEVPISDETFQLPVVPEGFDIKLNGADLEQIIASNGKVVHPLVDKTVQVSFEVTDLVTNESKITSDIPYVVKGRHQADEGANEKPVVIPEIQEWTSNTTDTLDIQTIDKVVYTNDSLGTIVDEFILDYESQTGITLTKEKNDSEQANAFNFIVDAPDNLLGDEGYTMDILADRVIARSESTTGNMYAMQTILQMNKQNRLSYNIGSMRDYPRFKVRGFLFDVARKPISMELIKEVSRTMRYYKMNDLQLHLSDNYIFLENYGKGDQENEAFKAYDAFRLETSLTNDEGESPTAEDYYFTKDEFKTYINSERSMGMRIVPEIDVPAHANSFTKIWPEIMVKNKVSSLNGNRPLIDHIDVSKQSAIDKIKEIFDEYTKGADPVFDSETIVHIGADEFLSDYTAYRKFVNQIVPYIKETNTVRMWGGLTWINDGKTQIIDEAIENVEMNLWSSGWADGIEMYDMGYKLINTIDSYNYMVPNGGMGRGAYGDLLNINSVFNNFEANLVATRSSGWKYIPSGDDQALGAVFAIWSDNIDKHASGLDESDYFYRFFDALPVYAEKTWAATGKEKGTIDNLTTIASNVGIGPRTNPYFQLESKTDELATYTFGDLSDTSGNNRDILENKAKLDEDALVLDQKKSYVETPITKVGKGNELSFDITMNKVGKPGQVIFESDAAYGTQDIRIMESGKLGFTRELYDYEFDYTLPVGKNVNIRIVSKQQKTELHVNGKFIGNAVGKYFHNDILKKENLTNASFNIPIQRIGSKTNAVQATIDNVKVSKTHSVDTYNKSAWAGQTNTETIYNDVEGRLSYAFDNNASSIWHSNWKGATDKLTGNNTFYAEIDMNETYTINSFSFTPRTDTNSGLVTKADLFVKASNDEEWIQVAEDALFAADRSQKTFYFDEQDVRYIKFVAKSSNDGWVAVSEFDVASIPKSQMNVYVDYTGEGTVDGTGQYDAGTEVTLTATPAKGYVFIGWIDFSDTVISTDSTLTFTVNANTNLEARFTREAYVVDIDGTEYLVPVGEGLDLPRPQKPGYEFDGYYEGDTKVDVAKPFENDVNLSTKFVPYSVEIKIEDTSHGSVEVTRNEDGSVTINALPSNGYVFKSWSISERTRDEATVVTDNPYTFIPTMHTIVNVTFEKDETESTDVQKTALKLFIDMMDENVTLGYVDELIGPAKTEVLEALAEAKTIYEKVDATEEEVNASVIRLSEAFTYLSLVKGDLTLLQQLYDTCNALDLDKYHNGATKELFIEALEYAYGILTLEGGALQPEIDEALENLNTTYAGLVSKPDKSLLAYLINVANSKSSMHERYTETSYAALVEALSKSQVVYDNPEATKAEVEKQVSDLSMAISSLRLKVDRSYLEEKVKAIKSISYDMYTEASVTKLMEAIEKVEAFLITPEGDAQQEANMMLELSKILDEAVYGLEKKANGDASHTKPNHPDYVISNPSVDTKDGSSTKPSKNVNSGDETQSGTLGLICISSLLGVMILLFKKKKERI